MDRVIKINDTEFVELQMIVMDKDKEAALKFLKENILKPLERSDRQSLDPSKRGSMTSR